MQTNDPHLSKTPIEPTAETKIDRSEPVEANHRATISATDDRTINDAALNDASVNDRTAEDPRLAAETSVNKGTETFDDKEVVGTEHVNAGDMPARQPDRRDQEGNAFDDGVNDKTTANTSPHNPKSDEITDLNRYASVDNAQSRVLNTTDQQD